MFSFKSYICSIYRKSGGLQRSQNSSLNRQKSKKKKIDLVSTESKKKESNNQPFFLFFKNNSFYNRLASMKQFGGMSKRYTRVQQEHKYESKMTSEQQYHSIAESVLSKLSHSETVVKGCPMHPKLSKKCRKCQQIQSSIETHQQQEQIQLTEDFPDLVKINTSNVKSHFNEKLQNNIENSYLFKSKLKPIIAVRDLVNELTSDEISIDTYMSGSTQNPTMFFCYFYRLAELRPTKEQLTIMLRSNNVNVRCLGLLYLRVFADPTIVYACMNHSFKDNKLLNIETIGQYAMRLLDEQKLDHGGFRLPRLPIKIQRAITKKVNAIKQHREKEFERERERSRERERKRRQEDEEVRAVRQNRREESDSQSSSKSDKEQKREKSSEATIQLSLKEKIKLIEQKKAEQARRQSLLNSYKTQTAHKLQSDEEAYSENDSVQKIHMG